MRFQFAAIVTTALAASGASAQLSPEALVNAVDGITNLSQDTINAAGPIGGGNPLEIVPAAFKVLSQVKDIISSATTIAQALSKPFVDEFPEEGQETICDSFISFFRVSSDLINTIIANDPILSQLPVDAILTLGLRRLRENFDKIGSGILRFVPTCAGGVRMGKTELDDSLAKYFQIHD